MASNLTGIAAQAAAAYMSGGSSLAGTAMATKAGGGSTGGSPTGSGGGNGMNGGLGGGAGSGGLFGGAFDLSTRSSTDATTLGGGGFDGSGWAVNIGGGQQSSTSSPYTQQGYTLPAQVGYSANEYGLPQTVMQPQYVAATAQGAATATASISPTVLIGAGLLVLALVMKGRR